LPEGPSGHLPLRCFCVRGCGSSLHRSIKISSYKELLCPALWSRRVEAGTESHGPGCQRQHTQVEILVSLLDDDPMDPYLPLSNDISSRAVEAFISPVLIIIDLISIPGCLNFEQPLTQLNKRKYHKQFNHSCSCFLSFHSILFLHWKIVAVAILVRHHVHLFTSLLISTVRTQNHNSLLVTLSFALYSVPAA